MCRFPLLCKIIHTTHVEHFTLGYVAVLLLVAFGVWQVEPDITTFSDGLWYCFAVSTTIGFGDIVAVTAVGRILTVILVLYGIFVIALIPGVVVNYFVEFNKIRYNESLLMFMDRLEHLDTTGDFPRYPQFPQKIKKQSISFWRNALFLFAGKFFYFEYQSVACHLTV